MSFILDALKKSETDRQRQTSPGLIDVRAVAPRPRSPLWHIAIGVLLGVNLVVLIVVLTRGDRSAGTPVKVLRAAHTAVPAAVPTAPAAAASTVTGADFSPMDAPVYAPEIPVPPDSVDKAAAPLESKPPARFEPRLTRAASSRDSPGREGEGPLPTLDEMNLSGQKRIPELHLDIHVYDANPAGRFVFINMRKYREGAALQEGPAIEHITRAGVILNYQGLRFILPRQ